MVIKVIYKDGVFKPLDPVDLAEGVELEFVYTTSPEPRTVWDRHHIGHLSPVPASLEEFDAMGPDWSGYMPE